MDEFCIQSSENFNSISKPNIKLINFVENNSIQYLIVLKTLFNLLAIAQGKQKIFK